VLKYVNIGNLILVRQKKEHTRDSSDVVDCFALDILPGAPDDEKAM
jgi:hypothetical protein